MRSVYHLIYPVEVTDCRWWKFLWASLIHERLKFFMWRLSNKGFPTLGRLEERHCLSSGSSCLHGCGVTESDVHIFFKCQMACALWFSSRWSIRWDFIVFDNLWDFIVCLMAHGVLSFVHKEKLEDFFLYVVLLLNFVWKVRNECVFAGLDFDLEDSLRALLALFRKHKEAQEPPLTSGVVQQECRGTFWTFPPLV